MMRSRIARNAAQTPLEHLNLLLRETKPSSGEDIMNLRTVIAGLIVMGSALGQQLEQFDAYRFSIPQGWVRQAQNSSAQSNTAALVPQNVPRGQAVFIILAPTLELQGDFRTWFDTTIRNLHRDQRVIGATEAQTGRASEGYAVLATAAVVQDAQGRTQYRAYVAANPGNRVALVSYVATNLELFQQYQTDFQAFVESVRFTAVQDVTPGTPQPGTPPASPNTNPPSSPSVNPPPTSTPNPLAPNPPATTSGSLPTIAPPTYADIVRLGINPKRQPLNDEFRCYESRNGDDYSKPAFALQFLPGNQYRTTNGTGAYTTKADGSLSYVIWRSGPLMGSDDAFLSFNDDGQELRLGDVGPQERDFFCYQRGAREQVAQIEFRFKNPQPGAYPCVRTDGSNKAEGTLEILPGRRYRYGNTQGAYTVDILGRQRDDSGSVEFQGGPFNDENAFYQEDETGLRRWNVYAKPKLECRLVIGNPTRKPRFGSAKAPNPPAGSGGLEGAFYAWRIDVMAATMPVCGGLCWDVYFFNKNGYVFTDEPEESLEETDCSRTRPNGFPVCQVYRLQGNQITIGTNKPVSFQRVGKGLKIDGDDFKPLESTNGLKVNGTFRAFSAFSSSAGGSGGGFSEVILSFTSDGKFIREGSGGAFFNATDTGTPSGNTTASVSTASQRTNSGTYRFHANTLELKFGDGRVLREFAFVGGRDKKGLPSLLRIGGRDYSLREAKR